MAYLCEYCQKRIQAGHNIKHHRGVAGGRWKRKAQKTLRNWRPNLHNVRVIEAGKIVRRRLCTKCLRRADRPHQKTQDTLRQAQGEKALRQSSGQVSDKTQETKGKEREELRAEGIGHRAKGKGQMAEDKEPRAIKSTKKAVKKSDKTKDKKPVKKTDKKEKSSK